MNIKEVVTEADLHEVFPYYSSCEQNFQEKKQVVYFKNERRKL